jgi:hypothetical protein
LQQHQERLDDTSRADAGFVVVRIDGMGTNWRGKAFHATCWKNLRDAGFPDRVAWLRAAAETRPWVDLSRVGISGGGGGGPHAMRGRLDYPEIYRVGVADCGYHGNRMDTISWNEIWRGWPFDEAYECPHLKPNHEASVAGGFGEEVPLLFEHPVVVSPAADRAGV